VIDFAKLIVEAAERQLATKGHGVPKDQLVANALEDAVCELFARRESIVLAPGSKFELVAVRAARHEAIMRESEPGDPALEFAPVAEVYTVPSIATGEVRTDE
jgi:hypothetical protein